MQAAILIEKLKIFDDEIAARDVVARRYTDALGGLVNVPRVANDNRSVWAQYTVRLPKDVDRKSFMSMLKAQNIPTMVYYDRPMHQRTAYRRYLALDDGLPVSESMSKQVVSQPMHPYLDRATQDYIIDAVRRAIVAGPSG
jgi:dTDP-4-amino-4,6-dideoxygalactose transaminase